jgi:Membrane dipeptidase (Peptidase family M19)
LEMPTGLQRLCDWQNLVGAMDARGWTERRIARVTGENWVRYFADVWTQPPPSPTDAAHGRALEPVPGSHGPASSTAEARA